MQAATASRRWRARPARTAHLFPALLIYLLHPPQIPLFISTVTITDAPLPRGSGGLFAMPNRGCRMLLFAAAQPSVHAHLNEVPDLTLQPPFRQGNPRWRAAGDVRYDTSSRSSDYARLTSDSKQSSVGGLYTVDPVDEMGDEWEVTLVFDVWGRAENYFGDGFALWYTEDPPTVQAGGAHGRVFGARDYWKGLGIFFDTYDNGNRQSQNHPFISVMYNDGTQSFVHGDGGLQNGIPACHSREF